VGFVFVGNGGVRCAGSVYYVGSVEMSCEHGIAGGGCSICFPAAHRGDFGPPLRPRSGSDLCCEKPPASGVPIGSAEHTEWVESVRGLAVSACSGEGSLKPRVMDEFAVIAQRMREIRREEHEGWARELAKPVEVLQPEVDCFAPPTFEPGGTPHVPCYRYAGAYHGPHCVACAGGQCKYPSD
jgi:hypothetical protein